MLGAHFPSLDGKKKRKAQQNDEIQTLRGQVKQSALCLEQQIKTCWECYSSYGFLY